MTRNRIILALVLLLLLIGGAGAWYLRPDPEVEKAKEMGNDLIAKLKETVSRGEMPRPDSEEAKQFKETMGKLSKEQRREVEQSLRETGMEAGLNMMKSLSTAIVSLPEPLRNLALDKFIDMMESERQRREERRAKAIAEGRDPNQGQGQGPDSGEPRERRIPTAEEREKFMKKFLDKTRPDERARLVVAMQMLDDRRKQRGLPPMPLFGQGRNR